MSIWSQVLRLGRIDIYDRFFELGGYSLSLNAVSEGLQTQQKEGDRREG